MRTSHVLLALAVCLCLGGLSACSSNNGLGTNTDSATGTQDFASSSNNPDGTGLLTDLSSSDAHVSGDLAGVDLHGVSCGSSTCGSGEVCCVTANAQTKMLTEVCMAGTSCGDAGVTAACDGPEDCSSDSVCCGNLNVGGTNYSGESMCTATCTAMFTPGTGGTYNVDTRLCHTSADCAGYTYPDCCTYSGANYNFCAPAVAKLVKGVTCQ